MSVIVNGAFRPQRVTGQQRYAAEIADRLVGREGFVELRPDGAWTGGALREWGWTVGRLPLSTRGRTVLSLTARAPLAGRQVIVIHDLFVLTNPEWYSRKYIATHVPMLRAHLRAARAVVAVSEPVADEVRERFGLDVVVAPNAPSEVFRAPAEASSGILERHGLSPDGFLLTVGSTDPRKNLVALAEAYGSLSESERAGMPLVVTGGSAAIYRDGAAVWPAHTVSTGYVSDAELAELYANARAVVFPTKAEGFGLPLVEAAAAGTRGLVISDIPVFRWICGDGARYVDPASAASIAEGLRDAIAGRVPGIRLERDFDWDASADTVAEACLRTAGVGA